MQESENKMEESENMLVRRAGKSNASDHLANERTFLAWIRTSIAIMGFGFVVVKFSLFIRQLSLALGEGEKVVLPGKGYSAIIGIILVAIGAFLALLSFIRYRTIERKLLTQTYYPSMFLTLVLTVSILLISVLLVLYLLPSI